MTEIIRPQNHEVPIVPYSIDLPGTDLQVEGTLHGSLDQPLAILTHGNMGSGDDLLQYCAAHYLAKSDIAVLRLSMWASGESFRDRLDFTQYDYANDLTVVIDHLRKQGVPWLSGVGHSAGGEALLRAAPQIPLDAMVLWDPSHGLGWREYQEIPKGSIQGDLVINRSGYGTVRSVRQMKVENELGDTTKFASGKQNIMIISAGQGPLSEFGAQYFDAASHPKRHIILEEAGHCFTEGYALDILLDETVTWLKRFTD